MHRATMEGHEEVQRLLREAQVARDNDADEDGLAVFRWWGKRCCGYGDRE